MKLPMFAMLFAVLTYSLAEDLPPGHPTVQEALQSAGTETSDTAALPNQGRVLTTLQSRGYTYIEVEQDGKSIWLAAPKVELAEGTRIRFGEGITMANFYSNGLKREFEMILFVDRVVAE